VRPPAWLGTAALLLVLFLVFSVARDSLRPRLALLPAAFDRLAGWPADNVAKAIPAFLKSCALVGARADNAAFDSRSPGFDFGRVADWRPACSAAAFVKPGDDDAARRFLAANFVPVLARDTEASRNPGLGLFTGYYEIELDGSLRRHGRYQTPLYHRPPDPAVATRYSRAEIEKGALEGHGLAFLWLADPIDAFFLSIQGSGVVRLDNGKALRVGYDGQNGHPYVPVGRLLIDEGAIPKSEMSMAAIRAWMQKHPKKGTALRDADPSYVYFRVVHQEGAVGAEGVVLTPRRSLAVDRAYVALGVPIWLVAEERFPPHSEIRRLVVAQDVGGAIKGPVRGDLFWGTGAAAGTHAGAMNARGRYWLLLPPPVAVRLTRGTD
jgi:membrane-bound lytic murein transglycosylase A